MSSLGDALGTYRLFASCRSASRSDSISSLGEGGPESLERAAQKVADLVLDGFHILGIKRDQDRLGYLDSVLLHGFLILKLKHPDREAPEYLRLDWGEHGLNWQQESSEESLMTYVQVQESLDSQQRPPSRRAATAAAAGAGATAVTATYSGGWWMYSLKAVGAVVSGSIAIGSTAITIGLVVVAVVIATGPSLAAQYQEVPEPETALGRLRIILKELKESHPSYSLSSWNCNHFANHVLLNMLQTPSNETQHVSRSPQVLQTEMMPLQGKRCLQGLSYGSCFDAFNIRSRLRLS
mmetsp:Transcript_119874/g.219533  ORF Transcript_119874/g.219533 Transcript_119874/m.219533 type:complete len:295 (+) Transcript_119874:51-935(+)